MRRPCFVVAILTLTGFVQADDRWVTHVCPHDPDEPASPIDVNDGGVVVGGVGGPYAGAWICAYGEAQALAEWFPNDRPNEGLAINSHRHIVGVASFDLSRSRGYRYDFDTAMLFELGTLGGLGSVAFDINDSGDIVGAADDWFGYGRHAVLWTNGQTVDLTPDAPPGTYAHDVQITNSGLILGRQGNESYLWQEGVLSPLLDIFPVAMNNHGDIVGIIPLTGGIRGIRRNGVVTEMPMFAGATLCEWEDIADDGTIVGYCTGGVFGQTHRAIAIVDGEYLDLTPAIATGASFIAVSDGGGVLLGYYELAGGSQRVFTLSLRGDMNWDGTVDFFDIDFFLLGLFNQSGYRQQFGWDAAMHGDVNGDGSFDFFDVDPFLAVLFGT